jgi:hypothetical protein
MFCFHLKFFPISPSTLDKFYLLHGGLVMFNSMFSGLQESSIWGVSVINQASLKTGFTSYENFVIMKFFI